ncbi:MAG: hypothetical protein M3Y82_13435, partial [Verrucomicrobiota bacterium]|nr:hypothetical protein [Verrucomicrobiota bacterium]
MKFFSFFFAIFLTSYLAKAHSPGTSVRSSSQQFIVHGPAPLFNSPGVQPSISRAPMAGGWFFMITPNKLAQDSSTKPRVALEQNLVAVSCERIKEALGQQVGLADRGAGKIHLYLNPFLREEEITMASTYYSDGWAYAVELPTQIEESRFVRTVVEILLIEQANRSSAGQANELPRWLVDGLAAHLQATVQESLALQMNLQTRQSRRFDPLASVRAHLRETVPLTFNELSWPENLSSERAALYQDCAQLFVSQLLRLKEGRGGLRRFIENFAENKNWQFSFLRAFHFQFGQLIDVEKWWALQLISFTGRDPK